MNSQKGSAHVIIIIVLVVALLGTLGFVFWQNFGKETTNQTAKNSTSTNMASTKPATSQAFKYEGSHQYNVAAFSFQYPLGWTAKITSGQNPGGATGPLWSLEVLPGDGPGDSISMTEPDNSTGGDLDSYISKYVNTGGSSNGVPFVYNELNRNPVGGDKAISFSAGYGADQGGLNYETAISHKGYVYVLNTTTPADSNTLNSATQSAYDQILQTWKWSS